MRTSSKVWVGLYTLLLVAAFGLHLRSHKLPVSVKPGN